MKSKKFHQYRFFENGDVVNTKTNKSISKQLNKGSYEIKLTIDGSKKTYAFHRLYYFLFVKRFDLADKNICISIKDGNINNITADNLVLKNRKEIVQGQNTKVAKLTDKQVEEIRSLYKGKTCINQFDKDANYVSYKDLAEKYGVSKTSICRIIKGESRNKANYKLR